MMHNRPAHQFEQEMAEPWLPMDLLIEVLILVPVKSILKFRCVSKTWRDLISSPLFIDRHLKCETKQRILLSKRYLLQKKEDKQIPQQNEKVAIFSFHDLEFPELLVSPNLSIPIFNDDFDIFPNNCSNIPIHGPCNGLVCISLEKIAFLCNPALREFKLLPPLKFPEGYVTQLLLTGFGFDQIAGVYKVIQIRIMTNEFPLDTDGWSYFGNAGIWVYLYCSISNSWKQIDVKVPDFIVPSSDGLFLNGAIHWYSNTESEHRPCSPCILCFDTSLEAFRELDFHYSSLAQTDGRLLRLLELDGCIATVLWDHSTVFDDPSHGIEIWVMKEYGVKESWTKLFVMGTYYITWPLLFLKNKWLVCENNKGQLAACTIEGNQFKEFEIYGLRRSFSAVVYEESLISLKDIISK